MRAKKSLGQHFLTSQKIVHDIIATAELAFSDTVLEIGPGKGVLTEGLLKKVAKVIAVEKDRELVMALKETFYKETNDKQLILVEGDILTLDLNTIMSGDYKIVANIPYYITGKFLRNMLSQKKQPTSMVLMVQQEVAKRIVASDSKESLLSISVKAYGTPHYIAAVSKKYFKPQPKVDSAIIKIENISRAFFATIDEDNFFTILKAGFAHKRKLLMRNIESLYNQDIKKLFTSLKISHSARAEELTLNEWGNIAKALQ